MGFIERPMDEVEEAKYGPKGLYDLIIKDATDKMDGDKRKNIFVVIEIQKAPQGVEVEKLANVMHNLSMPLPEDEDTKAQNKVLFGARFCHQFGIDMKGRKLSDVTAKELIGKRAKGATLDIKVYEGTTSNVLKVAPLPQKK